MTGDEIYVWQVLERGEWGAILAAAVPAFGPTVLIARNVETADRLAVFAVAHHEASGLPVRLARFDQSAIVREIPATSITCPRCGATSHNPNDVAEGYCGACHDWTGRD